MQSDLSSDGEGRHGSRAIVVHVLRSMKVMVMVELLLPRVSCRPPEAVLEPEQTVRRAVAVRFDRSITCVFRQQPSPSVRTIDKTMVDGHGFRVPRPPTAPRGTGTTPTTRVAATQVAVAQATAIGPFGLRSRAQVRTHARTHARWSWWY